MEGRIRLAGQGPDDDEVGDDLQWIDLLDDDVTRYVFKLDVVHECFDFFPILTSFSKNRMNSKYKNLKMIEFPLQLVLHHIRAA